MSNIYKDKFDGLGLKITGLIMFLLLLWTIFWTVKDKNFAIGIPVGLFQIYVLIYLANDKDENDEDD